MIFVDSLRASKPHQENLVGARVMEASLVGLLGLLGLVEREPHGLVDSWRLVERASMRVEIVLTPLVGSNPVESASDSRR